MPCNLPQHSTCCSSLPGLRQQFLRNFQKLHISTCAFHSGGNSSKSSFLGGDAGPGHSIHASRLSWEGACTAARLPRSVQTTSPPLIPVVPGHPQPPFFPTPVSEMTGLTQERRCINTSGGSESRHTEQQSTPGVWGSDRREDRQSNQHLLRVHHVHAVLASSGVPLPADRTL